MTTAEMPWLCNTPATRSAALSVASASIMAQSGLAISLIQANRCPIESAALMRSSSVIRLTRSISARSEAFAQELRRGRWNFLTETGTSQLAAYTAWRQGRKSAGIESRPSPPSEISLYIPNFLSGRREPSTNINRTCTSQPGVIQRFLPSLCSRICSCPAGMRAGARSVCRWSTWPS